MNLEIQKTCDFSLRHCLKAIRLQAFHFAGIYKTLHLQIGKHGQIEVV
jgi:hypothetical protein